jgi:predicted RNA-binding protein YlqC (UPF0109 family)
MTTVEQTAGLVLERLILSLLDFPREAELEPVAMPSRINWKLVTNINDAGKVIGIKGAHAKALQFVAGRMGDQMGQEWRLAILDPKEGQRTGPRAATPPPLHFSPASDVQLLSDVLTFCTDQLYAINAEESGGASWTFRVTPRDWSAQEAIADRGGSGELLADALAVLFRAVGRRQGVGYKVEVG